MNVFLIVHCESCADVCVYILEKLPCNLPVDFSDIMYLFYQYSNYSLINECRLQSKQGHMYGFVCFMIVNKSSLCVCVCLSLSLPSLSLYFMWYFCNCKCICVFLGALGRERCLLCMKSYTNFTTVTKCKRLYTTNKATCCML